MSDFIFKKAELKDIDFIVEAIVEAEKSGSELLSYTTIFGISEKQTFLYLKEMLEENIDGCELSISSYWIAELNNKPIATMGAWIEDKDLSSSTIKGSLLGYTLPIQALEQAKTVSQIVSKIAIEYIPCSLCIGIVYVSKKNRGENLVSFLLNKHIEEAIKVKNVKEAYIQVFGNNIPAIKAYAKLGFNKFLLAKSDDKSVLKYLPSSKKYFLKKEI